MLRIRSEQQEALVDAYRELYVDRTCQYFRRNWSGECEGMDSEALRSVIRDARGRAESYGIYIEADVVRFTEVWLLLGEDFDHSPKYRWAPDILTNEDTDGTIKTEQLASAAVNVLAAGENKA
jgi:hypothetical protein